MVVTEMEIWGTDELAKTMLIIQKQNNTTNSANTQKSNTIKVLKKDTTETWIRVLMLLIIPLFRVSFQAQMVLQFDLIYIYKQVRVNVGNQTGCKCLNLMLANTLKAIGNW